MTKIIGLTGGIGSGKTTVAKYIASKGIPVYVADDKAREIMARPEVVTEIVKMFGTQILDGQTVDRSKLAAVVFSDPGKLETLNKIIHPKVRENFSQWLREHKVHPYVFKESAILFETGSYRDCDMILLITAPEQDRIDRVMLRDNVTAESVRSRISNQWSEADKISGSDEVIHNYELSQTFEDVDEFLKKLSII